MSYKKLIILASRTKFKNPPDAPESIFLRVFHKKIEPIRPRGLSCRGAAIDFGTYTSYNSGTSVEPFPGRRTRLENVGFAEFPFQFVIDSGKSRWRRRRRPSLPQKFSRGQQKARPTNCRGAGPRLMLVGCDTPLDPSQVHP